jgi:Glycoside-hydrolase family GH114
VATAESSHACRRWGSWLAWLLPCLVALALLAPDTAGAYWVPPANATWQWQLSVPVDQTVDAEIYDIDLFTNEASVVAALHAQGRHVVCYMDAGTWEAERPDEKDFPPSVLGSKDENFKPEERWLDIRQLSILEPIMTKRLELCKAKGFDGVEADNIEGWENESGFPITEADQLVYNEWLAGEAHKLGLSIAMKNDVEQTKELQPFFDWDLTEECAGLKECSFLKPFQEAHKAIWSVEYNKEEPAQFCPEAVKEGFMAMKKKVELNAWQAPCWPQGNWRGKKGADGYDLAAFNGTSDLVNMPGVTATLTKGSRLTWATTTTDARGLENPTGTSRTAAAYSDPAEVEVQLHFERAYKGNLHLYAVDWDSTARRESIAAGGVTASLTGGPFSQGSWVSIPINAAANATVPVKVKRTAGTSAVLSAIMLGDAAPSVPPAPTGGSWTGVVGASGYELADWDGTGDVGYLSNTSLSVLKASRYQWATNTTDARALQSPDGLTRSASTYYDPSQIDLQLHFPSAFSGNLHLYAVDWDSLGRREKITVEGQTTELSSDFTNGAWVSFPVSVAAGGTVTITVDRLAGPNAVLSGIFLGDAGAPPAPTVTSAPQGSWVGSAGSAGYDLASWGASLNDISYLPNASLSVLQANRYQWASNTSDARALSDPGSVTKAAGTYYDSNQVRLTLSFPAAYTGNLHLYAVDWDSLGRREIISVNGQSAVLSSDFTNGAWVSFPMNVAAGATVTITVDRLAGPNAVLSGVFLG